MARGRGRFPVFCCGTVLIITLILSSVFWVAADDPESVSHVTVLSADQIRKIDKISPNSVTFTDIDDDGGLEIIAAAKAGRSGTGKILIIDSKTCEEKQEYKLEGNIPGIPAVGKIVNDDKWLDVAAACDNGRICVFDGVTGKLGWEYKTSGSIEASPVLTDVNGDGLMDVVIGSGDKYIYVLNGKAGDLLWKYQTRGRIRLTAAVGDLDGDGVRDLVAADEAGFVYAMESGSGKNKWYFTAAGSPTCSPCIADIDGDGFKDVIIRSNDGNIYAINGPTGRQLWRKSLLHLPNSKVSIADVNGDNIPEVLAGTMDAGRRVLRAIDGRDGSGIWRQSVEASVETALMVADIDIDGSPEIIVGGSNYIYAMDGNTGQQRYRYHVGKGNFFCPAVLDINGNGLLDIAAADSNSLYILYTSSKATVLRAKTYGDCYNTGSLDVALAYASDPVGYPRKELPESPKMLPDLKVSCAKPLYEAERGKTVELELSVANEGMRTAKAVTVTISGEGFPEPQKVEVGDLPAGEKDTIPVSVNVPKYVEGDVVGIRMAAVDSDGYRSNEQPVQLELRSLQPDLVIARYEIDDEDGDKKVEPGETATIEVTVENKGFGIARNVVLELVHTEVAKGIESQKPLNISVDMPPGASRKGSFTLPIPQTHTGGKMTLQVKLSDESGAESSREIEFEVKASDAAPPQTADLERWALLIGIDKYQDEDINPLRFATDDVQALRDILIDPLHGGFKPEKVRVLTNDKATRGNVLKELANWLSMAKENDIVLIYYSGHGIEHEGESYLLPVETDIGIISAYGIRNREFVEAVDRIKADKIIAILDCCHSGGVSASGKAVGETLDNIFYKDFKESKGKVTFASCGPGEQSYEWAEKGHGVFTYYLVEGIRGDADGKANNDGYVTFSELSEYVQNNVIEWAKGRGKRQTPEVQTRHLTGDIPLAINVMKMLQKLVLELRYAKKEFSEQAMNYAFRLLEEYEKSGKLSSEDQGGLDMLIDILNERIEPKAFEIWVKSR